MLNIPHVTLNNGVKIPQLGLGVFQAAQGSKRLLSVACKRPIGDQ